MRQRFVVGAALVVLVLAASGPSLGSSTARSGTARHHRTGGHHGLRQGPEVVDVSVSFRVRNINRSAVANDVACTSDGATYPVYGHLVAPAAVISATQPRAVTLYIHGAAVGEQIWRNVALPGYDWAYELAKAGHASVTYDQLGFGRSGTPNGSKICIGSQADIAHQLVEKLRTGSYEVAGGQPVSFQRVALGSWSTGGLIASVEAYSFRDIDALASLSSAFDQGVAPSPLIAVLTKPDGVVAGCARGGEPKRAGGPSGYLFFLPDSVLRRVSYNADPAIVRAGSGAVERDPCGEGTSLLQTLAVDRLRLGTITVPVLLLIGDHDVFFPPPDGEQEAALFSGSRDVTYHLLPTTGHYLQGERTASLARMIASAWLRARGL